MLGPDSRETGIEWAVGWFLFALAIGLLIPREWFGAVPQHGFYRSLQDTGHLEYWIAWIAGAGLLLIVLSRSKVAPLRVIGIVVGIVCWLSLSLRFAAGNMWGAAIQAFVGIYLLNACAWRVHACWKRARWERKKK